MNRLDIAFNEAKKRIGFNLENNISFIPFNEKGLKIEKTNNNIQIIFNKKHECFFGATLLKTLKENNISIECPYEHLGVMVDCARNGVPNIEALKTFIVHLAFLGYSYIGLYLEDCFEVENEPYFGYMRGRYSKEELKEIVEFSDLFGIEVVPYIQTLAHLGRIFNHYEQYTSLILDVNDILLVDEERTYVLIENMINSISSVFKTKRINIGMDEAQMMLFGTYRKKHGIKDRGEVFSRHIERVFNICKKYGLEPAVWADMFENHLNDTNLKLPKGLTLTVWEYSYTKENDYLNKINRIKTLTDNVSFAGGVHKFYGYAPLNEYTLYTLLPSIKATKGNVKDYCITLWGDDGAECTYNGVWYSLLEALKSIYNLKEDTIEDISNKILGYSLEELLSLDLPNKVFKEQMKKPINISKYALFEDLFYGITDKTTSEKFREYYVKNEEILRLISKKQGFLSEYFTQLFFLCDILKLKCGLRNEIIKSYEKKDKNKLLEISNIINLIIQKVEAFKNATEKQWMKDYKPFGFEVQQIRLAGLKERLGYIERKLENFAKGEIEKIEELEEKNLSPKLSGDNYKDANCYNSYKQNVTYGLI